MDGPGGYYAKCNKSDRKKQIDFTYMLNLKNKCTNKTKQKQNRRYREQTAGCQRRGLGGGE